MNEETRGDDPAGRSIHSARRAAMRAPSLAVATLALLAAPQVNADSISYSIYSLAGAKRTLLVTGSLEYGPYDLEVRPIGKRRVPTRWESAVTLEEGYHVGILAKPGKETQGLGLWVRNDGNITGFSWEWFRPEKGDVFAKLQGTGRLRVHYTEEAGAVRMSSVEFLDDIELRFQQDICRSQPGEHTHVVAVAKGSVLSVASQQVAQANLWNAKEPMPPCPSPLLALDR